MPDYLLLYNMLVSYWPVFLILFIGMVGSVRLRKLTPAGAVTGGVTGLIIFLGTGYTGLLLMALFFIVGTAATAWKRSEKLSTQLSDKEDGRRTAAQVLANAGVAGLLALLALVHKELALIYGLALAAVFSSATADTLSSELGNVYGKRFYNILTFKRDCKGLDGVVSLEGTIAGVMGSLLIAIVYSLGNGFLLSHFIILILAGTIGNIVDSILGATLERKGILQNNAVNFLNTSIAAITAILLYFIFNP